MTNEVESFLNGYGESNSNGFKTDESPFGETQEVTSNLNEEETKGGEEEEEKLPYHKDPKVQKYIQREIEKALKENTPSETQRFIKETVSNGDAEEVNELVEAFTNIIGNDTPEKVRALKMLDKQIKGIKEEAQAPLRQLQEEREREVMEERQAEDELNTGFENIEETFGIDLSSKSAQKTKNDFIDFVRKVSPKNEYGEVVEFPDFVETFGIFNQINKKQTTNPRAKELSSRSIQHSSDASTDKPVATGKRGWKGVEDYLRKLSD